VSVEILLLVTARAGEPSAVLPALDLLPHSVRTAPRDVRTLVSGPSPDAVMVDARSELSEARATCRMLHATGLGVPLVAVVTEAGLIALNADWGVDDVILASAGPAEVEARLRLGVGRLSNATAGAGGSIRAGELNIDPDTYAAKLKGRPLDLTYKEFELLKFLAQHRAGSSPATSCCARSGATTTSAAPGPWTCTCGGCGPSSARSTKR
jgi:DNA-binding response OmpR family regulator